MRTRWKFILLALVVVVAGLGAGVYWFFRDDAPPAVALSTAVASVTDPSASTTSVATTDTTSAAAGGLTGTWSVDTTTGDFDWDSATGSFAGFRISEKLASIGSTTAVGRTGDITGTVEISGTMVSAASFKVDLTTITTNNSQRNDKVQSALETSQYPDATFTLVDPIDLGSSAASGKAVSVTAVGDLTIHGVTKRVQFPLEAQLVNNTVVIVGSVDVTFSDYNVQVPASQIVLSVADHGTLELQALLVKA